MATLKEVKAKEQIQLVLELLNKSTLQTKFSLQFGTPILPLYKASLNVMQDMMSSSFKDKSSPFYLGQSKPQLCEVFQGGPKL